LRLIEYVNSDNVYYRQDEYRNRKGCDIIRPVSKAEFCLRGSLTRHEKQENAGCIIEHMCQTLIANDRVEVRGFGAFSLHYHPARVGRNPKTGEFLNLSAKYLLHFKPGKELRVRVNQSRLACQIRKEDQH